MTQSVDKVNKNGAKSDQHQAGGAGDDDFPAPGGAGGNREDPAQILHHHHQGNFVTYTDIVMWITCILTHACVLSVHLCSPDVQSPVNKNVRKSLQEMRDQYQVWAGVHHQGQEAQDVPGDGEAGAHLETPVREVLFPTRALWLSIEIYDRIIDILGAAPVWHHLPGGRGGTWDSFLAMEP